jgi:uridine phosphorylase
MLLSKRTIEKPIEASELILNANGSVYHLAVRNEDIADDVIVVGDQDRVALVSKRFDKIDFKAQHREFVTHTGTYKGKRMTVMSTGIGPDNIDIVLNELDAAVNIDPKTRLPKETQRKLNIVRLGTSGSLREDIPVDAWVLSSYAIGFDGTAHFYDLKYTAEELALNEAFKKHLNWSSLLNPPYTAKADETLVKKISSDATFSGITLTAGGFYAPQGRMLFLNNAIPDLNERLRQFSFQGERVSNFEMESSLLFTLAGALGHASASILAIIANRYRGEFTQNAAKTIDNTIDYLLEKLLA